MAAWFILSALGFYPICPGKPEYVLGSPLFDRVTLHLAGGKKSVIEAHGQSASAVYVSKFLIDGKAHADPVIAHEQIVGGSHLSFSMQSEPACQSA
jgi:putative alpha-1,2-mannosidase